jgi:YD repeat-containing protein
LGRWDTNTVTAYLPASVAFVYDGNGNLRTNGTRILDYDDENQLIRITEPGAWLSEFVYDGKMRRRIRREYVWQTDHWTLNTEVHYVYDGMLVLQKRHYNPQLSTLNRPSPTPGAGI